MDAEQAIAEILRILPEQETDEFLPRLQAILMKLSLDSFNEGCCAKILTISKGEQ